MDSFLTTASDKDEILSVCGSTTSERSSIYVAPYRGSCSSSNNIKTGENNTSIQQNQRTEDRSAVINCSSVKNPAAGKGRGVLLYNQRGEDINDADEERFSAKPFQMGGVYNNEHQQQQTVSCTKTFGRGSIRRLLESS